MLSDVGRWKSLSVSWEWCREVVPTSQSHHAPGSSAKIQLTIPYHPIRQELVWRWRQGAEPRTTVLGVAFDMTLLHRGSTSRCWFGAVLPLLWPGLGLPFLGKARFVGGVVRMAGCTEASCQKELGPSSHVSRSAVKPPIFVETPVGRIYLLPELVEKTGKHERGEYNKV